MGAFVEGFTSAAAAPGEQDREQESAPEEMVSEDPEPEPEPDSESASATSAAGVESSSDDDGEDSGGRGSKRAVLADLAGNPKVTWRRLHSVLNLNKRTAQHRSLYPVNGPELQAILLGMKRKFRSREW